MTAATAAFLLFSIFCTAVLTGVFGLAGGLVLMGALALVLPVKAAFVTHGLVQIVANGSRAILHRKHIRWRVVAGYAAGSVVAALVVLVLHYAPSKPVLYLLLGLMPGLVWLPKLQLDAAKPVQAVTCGLLVTGTNLMAGVAGPVLDVFFVRTQMTRHQIVSTKAATQVLSHLTKVVVYGGPLLSLCRGESGMPPIWLFAIAACLSILGTVVGGRILDRLNDIHFKAWTRWIVTAIGSVYLVWASVLYWRH